MHENSSNYNIGWKSIQINVMNKYLQVIHSKFNVHNLIAMQTNFQNCMSNMFTSKHFKTYAIFKSLRYKTMNPYIYDNSHIISFKLWILSYIVNDKNMIMLFMDIMSSTST